MRALVVYESMYGNTRLVAEAIGEGLRQTTETHQVDEVDVVPVGAASGALLARADLVVVGGPTHAHGMSRPASRETAAAETRKPDSPVTLDPDAAGPGLREWFDALPPSHASAAAFDTRVNLPALFTGRASKGIGQHLRRRGMRLVAAPESFLVDRQNHLEPAELARARDWGRLIAVARSREIGGTVRHE
jgi:hypothetical protein